MSDFTHPKELRMRFSHTPKLQGKLSHWHYDTFLVEWDIRQLNADAFVTFFIDADGQAQKISMKPASPLVDFSYDFADLDPIRQK